jgi:glycosyltransferase involved in cell wall biosynthesis
LVVFDGKATDLSGYTNTRVFSLPSKGNGKFGNIQRNLGIDNSSGDYLYFLDDDSIVHPIFFGRMMQVTSGTNAIVVNQTTKTKSVRLTADKNSMKVCMIDTAQFLIPAYMTKDTRWLPFDYCADGIFFTSLYSKYPNDFTFIKENLCYYNFLR